MGESLEKMKFLSDRHSKHPEGSNYMGEVKKMETQNLNLLKKQETKYKARVNIYNVYNTYNAEIIYTLHINNTVG